MTFLVALASVTFRCAAPTRSGSDGGGRTDPCSGDTSCRVLADADGDGDYADDFQKVLNELAYRNLTTAAVNGEVIASDPSGYFGLPASDPSAPAVYYPLDNRPIAIQSGGTCSDGGSQIATITSTGAITGDVTAAGDTVTDGDINCSMANCTSGISGVLYLHSPTDWKGLVCERSGAKSVVFTSASTCTGSTSLCTVSQTGNLTIFWTAGTGATTCSYVSRASNTVVWNTNATRGPAQNGHISARWANPPTGTTTCDYTYVTSANGGIDANPITIVPPSTPSVLEWTSTVHYCRNADSNSPTGYMVPNCDSIAPRNNDDLPLLKWHENWDNTEIHCNVPLVGGGARNHCLKVGNDSNGFVNASTRPGVDFQGAPLVSMTRTGVTPPTDYFYGFWFDGIDDSTLRLRSENTGDADNLVGVIVGDHSTVELGSRNGSVSGAVPGIIYVDGASSDGLEFSPLSGQSQWNHPDLIFGSPHTSYYDPAQGQQITSLDNINGCGYTGGGIATCASVAIDGLSDNIDIEGIPRDFNITNQTGTVEFHSDESLATTTMFSQAGPASVHCRHCSQLRLHGNAGATGGLITTDSFTFGGVIDNIQNDAITPSSLLFHRFTVMLGVGYLGSFNTIPYGLGPIGSHIGPGLIDIQGTRDYEWYIDDLATVSADTCIRKKGSLSYAPVACTDPDAFFEYLPGKSFLGRVVVELTKDVESTSTECDLTIEIAGGCTACTDAEAGTGKVFKIGGTDIWGRPLRATGDWTQWALNDAVTAGQNITAELRPVSGGTACTAGSGCSCTGVAGLKVTVDELPALYDQ